MKILHVIARMNIGGTATYLSNLLEGLEERGLDTLLGVGAVQNWEVEDTKLQRVKFQRVPHLSREISIVSDFRARNELWRLIHTYGPDLIHTHTFKAGILVRSKQTAIPVVHTFHGHHLKNSEFGVVKRAMISRSERMLARRTDRIISVGESVKADLISANIGTCEQIQSIPPGARVPELRERQSIESRLGIVNSKLNVLWMGRITHVKRPDLAIELARRFPSVNFVLAGDGELRSELQFSATENVFFVGFQNSDEMFSIADVVLLTSENEGMPLTLIEAQLAGLPVVSTNVGSVSEIVRDGITGYVCSIEVDEISSSLKKLLEDANLRKQLGSAAKEYAKENFSINQMIDSHLELYSKVMT